MGLDREKTITKAERMLQSGKVQGAVSDLQILASAAPNDLALMNRIGDLLARFDRGEDALEFYERAADQFARGGLYPKAIALGKKILRVAPDRVETLSRLGEWYLARKLPGEARSYLLHAADQYLAAREFARAREVYERLVEAEPHEIRHRARLGEALAAEGRPEEAGTHLLALATSLRDGDNIDSLESLYRRAMELLPDRDEPIVGLVQVLSDSGREADAIDCLEARANTGAPSDRVRAELALLYDRTGRSREALDALAATDAANLPCGVVETIVRDRIERGDVDAFWSAVGASLTPSPDAPGGVEARLRLLERLAEVEPDGHVPALERLADWHERTASGQLNDLLERLHHAHETRGAREDADRVFERIVALDESQPDPPDEEPKAPEPERSDGVADLAPVETAPESDGYDVPVEAEAPSVPLNRTDEEFVSGRMTQAEILEKYGLRDKAVEQVREVVQRFPGHVESQHRLVRLMEDGGTAADLRDALVALALALRADGDADGARDAARRAAESAPLDEGVEAILAGLGLRVPAAETTAVDGAEPEIVEADPEPEPEPAEFATGAAPVEATDDEVVFDFEDDPDPGAADAGPVGDDVADEHDPSADETDPFGLAGAEVEDNDPGADDLAELAKALDTEMFADETAPLVPEAAEEESLEDVLAAFKERVQEELGDDDPRMRYDLAIGYKEMGMLDEAVAEFEVAAASDAVRFEASVMIAVIRRDQGDIEQAVTWYRRALEACPEDDPDRSGADVRYDLADVLEEAGVTDEALRLFRDVSTIDPSYRDVDERIQEIESRGGG